MTALTEDEARDCQAAIAGLTERIEQVVVGQDAACRAVLTAFIAQGHVLLEGVPGVGKTLLARALAEALHLEYRRVQFTPDLMPADLIGTRIFDPASRQWELHKGPVFTSVLLADEINRTPPKTQAALLEAMAESQVTIDGERQLLSPFFFVIATENPLEFEGTYPLPEAQTDRFLLQVTMRYPGPEAELGLLLSGRSTPAERLTAIEHHADEATLTSLRERAERVRVDEQVARYVLALLEATRRSDALRLGASPRAGLMLLSAARAHALAEGRHFVIPEDVKSLAPPVLRHRLALSAEAELDGLSADDVLGGLLDQVAVRDAGEAAG